MHPCSFRSRPQPASITTEPAASMTSSPFETQASALPFCTMLLFICSFSSAIKSDKDSRVPNNIRGELSMIEPFIMQAEKTWEKLKAPELTFTIKYTIEDIKAAITGIIDSTFDCIKTADILIDHIMSITNARMKIYRNEITSGGMDARIMDTTKDRRVPFTYPKSQLQILRKNTLTSSTIRRARPISGMYNQTDEELKDWALKLGKILEHNSEINPIDSGLEESEKTKLTSLVCKHLQNDDVMVERNKSSYINPSILVLSCTPDTLIKEKGLRCIGVLELKSPECINVKDWLVKKGCPFALEDDRYIINSGHEWHTQLVSQMMVLRVDIGVIGVKISDEWLLASLTHDDGLARRITTNIHDVYFCFKRVISKIE